MISGGVVSHVLFDSLFLLLFHISSHPPASGCDELVRDDLGSPLSQNNPAEELNLFNRPGSFYGYPYCWSEYLLPNENKREGPGAQWVHPQVRSD